MFPITQNVSIAGAKQSSTHCDRIDLIRSQGKCLISEKSNISLTALSYEKLIECEIDFVELKVFACRIFLLFVLINRIIWICFLRYCQPIDNVIWIRYITLGPNPNRIILFVLILSKREFLSRQFGFLHWAIQVKKMSKFRAIFNNPTKMV